MDILILIVRGFMKVISKWGKKLFQSGAASKTFYFKVGQRQLFQSESMLISKWGKSYFIVEQLFQSGAKCYFIVEQLFQSGAIISKWGITHHYRKEVSKKF